MDRKHNYFNQFGIFMLRKVGREAGIASPTTLRKGELIAEIIKRLDGQTMPQPLPNIGRPPLLDVTYADSQAIIDHYYHLRETDFKRGDYAVYAREAEEDAKKQDLSYRIISAEMGQQIDSAFTLIRHLTKIDDPLELSVFLLRYLLGKRGRK